MKRPLAWFALFVFSVAVHAIISWRIGQDIDNPLPRTEDVEIHITLADPPKPKPIERPPPEDTLEFEEEFEEEPPDMLIQPEAVTPPPMPRRPLEPVPTPSFSLPGQPSRWLSPIPQRRVRRGRPPDALANSGQIYRVVAQPRRRRSGSRARRPSLRPTQAASPEPSTEPKDPKR